MPTVRDVFNHLQMSKRQRILAFGSSNTERYLVGVHWFDCVDLSLRAHFGRVHTCINSGISGNTTNDLLNRFCDDAAFFKPHLVFITIGGNDANPNRAINAQDFRNNLLQLYQQFSELGCVVIFQTYYAPNAYAKEQVGFLDRFYLNMEIIREVANQTQAHLIDHLARWEPFRQKCPQYYIKLMRNPMHVAPAGNMVMGLDIARWFGIPSGLEESPLWEFARQCQVLMDAAGGAIKGLEND